MNKREMDTLMKKVAEGDNDAFARLYGAAAGGVLAFAYSYLRNYADAEDVTEEVFFTVKKKAYLYRAGTDARAWLFQIAKNLSLDEFAEAKASVPPKLPQLDLMTECLDETEREIVLLHAVWGYKHREIAEATGLPLGTVTWKYNAALAKLRGYLEEEK